MCKVNEISNKDQMRVNDVNIKVQNEPTQFISVNKINELYKQHNVDKYTFIYRELLHLSEEVVLTIPNIKDTIKEVLYKIMNNIEIGLIATQTGDADYDFITNRIFELCYRNQWIITSDNGIVTKHNELNKFIEWLNA